MSVVKTRHILLIIENENSIREVTQLCLETIAGWEIITTDLVSEGIAIAASKKVDAILLDLNEMISDREWQDILQHLHNDPITQQIPVILLTSTEQHKDLPELTQLGVTGTIVKPFNLLTLGSRVANALKWEC